MTSAPPDSFVLSLPEGWMEVPLDPDELVAAIRQSAAERLPSGTVESLEFKHQMLVMRRIAQQAIAGGVVCAAAYSDAVEMTDASEPPVLLGAVMALATFSADSLRTDRVLFEHLQRGAAEATAESSIELLAEPTVIEVGGSPAVYVTGIDRVDDPAAGQTIAVLHSRFYLLIGAGTGMAALTFLTPSVELSEEFLELFYVIANSLEFTTA